MQGYAFLFFLISLVCAGLGFTAGSNDALGAARILWVVFLVLAMACWIAHTWGGAPRKPKAPKPRPENLVRIDELEAAFAIGRQFNYLGRCCRVTSCWTYRMVGSYDLEASAELTVDYVDKMGVIRSMTFTHREAMQLARELAP